MSRIFKVSCEFFVIANNTRDVRRYCREEKDFVGKHIEVEELKDEVEIYEDLTKEGGE